MARNPEDLNKKFIRSKPRGLVMIYDLLGFAAAFYFLFFWYYPAAYRELLSTPEILIHGVAVAALILGMRLLLKVYNLVLRYGNPGIYARILMSDMISGSFYVLINMLLPAALRPPLSICGLQILFTMLFSLFYRIAYHYIFIAAKSRSKLGNLCWNFLRRVAFVDARTEQDGAVLHLNDLLGKEEYAQASPINEIQRIARQFQIVGEITDVAQINTGYINRTFRVRTVSVHNEMHAYTLQRINTNVFPDVDSLMANFELVTEHLHNRLLLPGHGELGSNQMLRRTRDDKPYLRDETGCWRMMTHFTGVYGMDIPDTPETFYYAGLSFGTFVKCMADVPVEQIRVVIPNFHNTYKRYLDLETSVGNDAVNRLQHVWDEVRFIRDRKEKFRLISDALESGKIPTRICHNDCNLNNILFSKKTRLPVAIIDLDTVMPGSPLYDFGDSMRVGTNTAKDDETDLSKVSCDLDLYERYARGYLEACGDLLTREELELLPYAAPIITAEDGIRFLADYLDGDVYYNVFYPRQNLDRARTQLKLLADMEKKGEQIREILDRIYKELGLDADPFRIRIQPAQSKVKEMIP